MNDKLFQIRNHLSGRPSIKQHSLHISIWVSILHVMAIKQDAEKMTIATQCMGAGSHLARASST